MNIEISAQHIHESEVGRAGADEKKPGEERRHYLLAARLVLVFVFVVVVAVVVVVVVFVVIVVVIVVVLVVVFFYLVVIVTSMIVVVGIIATLHSPHRPLELLVDLLESDNTAATATVVDYATSCRQSAHHLYALQLPVRDASSFAHLSPMLNDYSLTHTHTHTHTHQQGARSASTKQLSHLRYSALM